jgi:hypothetical protein
MAATETPRRQIGRSAAAVALGILAGVVPTLITDAILHALHVFPPLGQLMSDGLFVLATAYRIIFSILGSYVIARLAPNRPMFHAIIGGIVGLVVSTIGAAVTWNHVPSLGPHWYPVALIVTTLPCAWLGGKLRVVQSAHAGSLSRSGTARS